MIVGVGFGTLDLILRGGGGGGGGGGAFFSAIFTSTF